MPDPCTIRFYDYYEAHIAAHRFEEEGHRAAVFEFVYSLAPWPGGEFRVVVFEGGQSGEPKPDGSEPVFGEFESGRFVRCLDGLLQYLTFIAMWMVPVLGLYFLAKIPGPLPSIELGMVIPFVFSLLLLSCGVLFAIASYHGYRREDPFWTVVVRFEGFLLLLSYGGILVMIVAAPLILTPLSERDEEEDGEVGENEPDDDET